MMPEDANRPLDVPKSARASAGLVTVVICSVIAVFEGFDLQAAGVAAPKLAPALGLVPTQLGWFFSSSTFGLMLGAAVGGRLSDRFGRKAMLLTSIGLFGLLSIATGLANDITGLVAARFLTGAGLGGALPNLLALITENTPPNRRNSAIGLLYAGFPGGGALSSLVSFMGSDPSDWRTIFYVGGLGPLLAFGFVVWLLPDTRVPDMAAGHGARSRAKISFVSTAFGEGRAITTLVLWLASFSALLTMYLLLNWLPSLLIGRGLSRPNAALVQIAFNLCGMVGSIAVGRVMDRSHWQRLTVPAVFIAGGVMLAMVSQAPVSPAISLWVGGALGATISAAQAVLYGLAPGVYPTRIRGTGVGMSVSIGRLGSAVGPMLAAQLLSSGLSPSAVLLMLVPVLAVAGIATVFVTFRGRKAV